MISDHADTPFGTPAFLDPIWAMRVARTGTHWALAVITDDGLFDVATVDEQGRRYEVMFEDGQAHIARFLTFDAALTFVSDYASATYL